MVEWTSCNSVWPNLFSRHAIFPGSYTDGFSAHIIAMIKCNNDSLSHIVSKTHPARYSEMENTYQKLLV